MSGHRRVILLVEATSAYGRGCLRGIARYARVQGGWSFYQGTRYLIEPLFLPDLLRWKADGIIARVENPHIAYLVRKLKVPTVDLRGSYRMRGVARVLTDDRKVVSMAAEHLLANGLQNLAFCGYPGIDFSDTREEIFVKEVMIRSGTKAVFHRPPTDRRRNRASYEQRGTTEFAALQAWLRQLPRPAGIIACNDTRGRQILEVCAVSGIRVPYDVAVVGVDDDDVQCELANPTLSSVAPNVEAIGFEAATLLDRMLAGEPAPSATLLVPPVALEPRGSSDIAAMDHPQLIEAVRMIRARAASGLNVDDLLSELCISRSTLERLFHEQLDCTPYAYILRCRIERVKQLLIDTRYSLAEISRMSGFSSPAHMVAAFRVRVGQTPAQYRRSSS